MVSYAKQTNTSLLSFYFYNIIQIPVFIIMVLSIRKISTENDDLAGAGCLWFPNLNEPDPYLLLPAIATILNYYNLGVSFKPSQTNHFFSVESQKKMSIGLWIDSGHSSKSFNFSTCHSRTSGQLVLLYIGSAHQLSCCYSRQSQKSSGSWTRSTQTSFMTIRRCTVNAHLPTMRTTWTGSCMQRMRDWSSTPMRGMFKKN